MFRRVLNSYLIVTLLAGPGLCCCSLTRASAKVCTDLSTREITAHSCCQNKTDKSPSGKPHHCPCRQHREQQITSVTEVTSASYDQIVAKHWFPSFEGSAGSKHPLIGVTDPDHLAEQSLDSLYPTSRDLLRALSVMRC